jgi:riboflavin synthase
MFTGLVEEVGRVERMEEVSGKRRLTVTASRLGRELKKGDSIAVSGVCLTAVEVGERRFGADLARETWERTSFSRIAQGAEVNLELPVRASDRLGGHVVQGHVDGVGEIASVVEDGFARRVRIEAPPEVLRYVIEKGSIAVDGVSLTVAGLDGRSFTVSLIPETLQRTNLGHAGPGDRVNLEVDVLAKYVEKLMAGRA